MRKQLVIALAYELKNFSNREEAYAWFRKTVEEYKLDSHEQFSLVFIGGGMNHRPENPEPAKVCPWEEKKVSYETDQPGNELTHLVKQKEEVARKVEKRMLQRPVHVSANCMKDARKALGVFPYDEPGNYLVGDGYFSRDCIGKYGEKMWNVACEIVRKER